MITDIYIYILHVWVHQVCIEAILHTDNTQHFAMVKELQMLYEMNSDVFDISMQMYQASPHWANRDQPTQPPFKENTRFL